MKNQVKKILDSLSEDSFQEEVVLAKKNANKFTLSRECLVYCKVILRAVETNGYGLAYFENSYCFFGGDYWRYVEEHQIESFLTKAAVKLGLDSVDANTTEWRVRLLKQLKHLSTTSKGTPSDGTNLANGVLLADGSMRKPRASDMFFYQLDYEYDPQAKAELFQKTLDRILPNKSLQLILAEFLGYILTSGLRLEKILFMYGTGLNGKSLLIEIIKALFGEKNICHYSIAQLTESKGYFRAAIGGKLLNVCSEFDGRIEPGVFKQLVSGEEVSARFPSQKPFILKDYGKLAVATNKLPSATEITYGFFRRFLIIPFEVTIPLSEIDVDLHKKIIKNELPGILNWVLEGRKRVINQKGFSPSSKSQFLSNKFQNESNSVTMFIQEFQIKPSNDKNVKSSQVYKEYKNFCADNGYTKLGMPAFKQRILNSEIQIKRISEGVVFLMEHNFIEPTSGIN